MIGRNGSDAISIASVVVALIFNIAANFFRRPVAADTQASAAGWVLNIIAVAFFAYAVFRILSRNIDRRRRENIRFQNSIRKLITYISNLRDLRTAAKYHKIFKCPSCGTRLRVPKNKGKLKITCTKCGQRFNGKT